MSAPTHRVQLARYLALPDANYSSQEIRSSRLGATEIIELQLNSQTWRGYLTWKHQLSHSPPLDTRGLVDPGVPLHPWWTLEASSYENGVTELPREAKIFTRLAETLRAPVIVLRQVPFQPIFDRREDALIAYTFDHYLETGETDWPLLLPMVRVPRARWTRCRRSHASDGMSGWTLLRSPAPRNAAGPRG